MAYAHIAHDCVLGNHITRANNGPLAGHVVIDDRAIIGGFGAVHQFVRIGYLSIIGGCSKVVQDVPPYIMVDGHPAKVYGLNSVGLERANISLEERSNLKKAFKIFLKPFRDRDRESLFRFRKSLFRQSPFQRVFQYPLRLEIL